MSTPIRYIDERGEVWTEVPGAEYVVFLEDEEGERFTFVWVENHFGPLIPEEVGTV